MKKFKLAILAAVMTLPAMAVAQAADVVEPMQSTYQKMGFYLRADTGVSMLRKYGYGGTKKKNSTKWVIGGGIGYQPFDWVRADLRFDYAGKYRTAVNYIPSGTTTVINNKTHINTLLVNAYFDIANESAFTPYVGVGIGYGWVKNSNKDILLGTTSTGTTLTKKQQNKYKRGFAYALMAGVGYNVTDALTLDVGYRMRSVVVKGKNPVEHQILAGIRYGF